MSTPTAWLEAAATVRSAAARRRGSPRAVVVVDPPIVDHPIVTQVREWLAQNSCRNELDASPNRPGVEGVLEMADRVRPFDVVVAIGGGSLLDVSKLATVVVGTPRFVGSLTVPQRSGLVLLSEGVARSVPLIAVPTTLGTGSENSPVAVLDHGPSKRLVVGLAIRPEARVHDAAASRGLPHHLVVEGIAEILARASGPYVGDLRDQSMPDSLAEAAVAAAVRLGDEVQRRHDAGLPVDGGLRYEIARLSAFTHSEWMAREGSPYAVKGWLLATEIACAAGARKMTATGALWPHLWDRIDAGDTRLGSATRLRRLFAIIRDVHTDGLPAGPGAGIARLLRRWDVDSQILLGPGDVQGAALRANRAWGAGLPMLGGLRLPELTELIASAATPCPGVATPATALTDDRILHSGDR